MLPRGIDGYDASRATSRVTCRAGTGQGCRCASANGPAIVMERFVPSCRCPVASRGSIGRGNVLWFRLFNGAWICFVLFVILCGGSRQGPSSHHRDGS